MDWTTLTSAKSVAGSIAAWINHSQIQAEAANIVAEAESWIYRRLRHWKMLTAPVTGTLTIGSDQLAIPSDCLEPFFLCTTGIYFQEIDQKPMEEVVRAWSYDSAGARVQAQPVIYSFTQSNIQFDSPPDQAYAYALIYYQQPAALSGSNTTNFLTSTYPRMLRAACMAQAAEWAKDAGMGNYDRTYWDGIAENEIAQAQVESDRARRAEKAAAVFSGGGNAGLPAYGW